MNTNVPFVVISPEKADLPYQLNLERRDMFERQLEERMPIRVEPNDA